MARFITLTLDSTGAPFSINVDQIHSIYIDSDFQGKPYTKVKTTRAELDTHVMETREEILALIEGREPDDIIPRQDATQGPIVLEIEHHASIHEPEGPGIFEFQANGVVLLRGSLEGCINARNIWVTNCEQNGVSYTLTDNVQVTI